MYGQDSLDEWLSCLRVRACQGFGGGVRGDKRELELAGVMSFLLSLLLVFRFLKFSFLIDFLSEK